MPQVLCCNHPTIIVRLLTVGIEVHGCFKYNVVYMMYYGMMARYLRKILKVCILCLLHFVCVLTASNGVL